jgi:dTDP-4-dehydrorhamnose 3,5-epimerase-like enzyme
MVKPIPKMIYDDDRGSLHSLKKFDFPAKEVLISFSHKGVVRGLHQSPYRKKIYIVSGLVYDFWFVPETGQLFEVCYC